MQLKGLTTHAGDLTRAFDIHLFQIIKHFYFLTDGFIWLNIFEST